MDQLDLIEFNVAYQSQALFVMFYNLIRSRIILKIIKYFTTAEKL